MTFYFSDQNCFNNENNLILTLKFGVDACFFFLSACVWRRGHFVVLHDCTHHFSIVIQESTPDCLSLSFTYTHGHSWCPEVWCAVNKTRPCLLCILLLFPHFLVILPILVFVSLITRSEERRYERDRERKRGKHVGKH